MQRMINEKKLDVILGEFEQRIELLEGEVAMLKVKVRTEQIKNSDLRR